MKKSAIIDIGSNSVRLVIYEGQKEIENIKVFAQLRRYLNSAGNIDPEGVENLLEALAEFSKMIAFYEVKNVFCAATATVRQAKNKDEILKWVREHTGLQIKIMTEYEEAFYGCQAILNSSPLKDGYTIDLGGGSTEITLVKNRELVHYHSFPFGAVSLKQQFVKGNKPTAAELEAISRYIRAQFATLPWIEKNHYPIYAIGGSARNLARAHQHLISYPLLGEHLYKMNAAALEDIQDHFNSVSFEYLSRMEGVNKDRADTIIPAAQTFVELCRLIETDAFYLSRKGFRDGLVAADTKIRSVKTIRKESIEAIAPPSPLSKKALQLSSQLKLEREDIEFLVYGLALYNIGKDISIMDSRAHSFYLIANRPIDGFTHKERVMLALLASYHSTGKFKKYIQPYQDWFTKEERQKLQVMGAIIKFVEAMDLQGKSVVNKIKISVSTPQNLNLKLMLEADFQHKKEELIKQKKHLERALKKDIYLEFICE